MDLGRLEASQSANTTQPVRTVNEALSPEIIPQRQHRRIAEAYQQLTQAKQHHDELGDKFSRTAPTDIIFDALVEQYRDASHTLVSAAGNFQTTMKTI